MEEQVRAFLAHAKAFMEQLDRVRDGIHDDWWKEVSIEELQRQNHALYEDILPEHYEESYANPAFAVRTFGKDWGRVFAVLAAEMRSTIPFVFEEADAQIAIRKELLRDVHAMFDSVSAMPDASEGVALLREYTLTHLEEARAYTHPQMIVSSFDGWRKTITDADLEDLRHLFASGAYVAKEDLETASFINALPEEQIDALADVFTKGFQRGFGLTGKTLEGKTTVTVEYMLSFGRIVRRAVKQFKGMGLQTSVYREYGGLLHCVNDVGRKFGFYGSDANEQYLYDHKDDNALFLDEDFVEERLKAARRVMEGYRAEGKAYAGPAVIETFGRDLFSPAQKEEAVTLSEPQRKLVTSSKGRMRQLMNEFLPEEERSFTVIAFPTAAIGEMFKEVFDAVTKINTLPYGTYQAMQQALIDTLDQATHCHIKGMNGNRTDLTVALKPLQNPAEETNFENCLADVNIPLGEVFTSPQLKGTNGVLHVSGVYLNDLYYKDLSVTFTDGCVADYSCSNFDSAEEGRRYIEDNVLFHHETLPMGEFAIGTNTTAYTAARKLQIQDKLPILIAEKTGPHFALGDTCYSFEEDLVSYNPDGKRIVARENEISAKRKTDPENAYFACHTDITLPYDELGALSAVLPSGEEVPIIKEGRFVLPGTEGLNEALGMD